MMNCDLNLLKYSTLRYKLFMPARFKSRKVHWAKLRRKDTPKYKALDHFDDFYASVFGKQWQYIRTALTERRPKYAALVNNYGDPEETMESLTNRGAHCLKTLLSVQHEFSEMYPKKEKKMSKKPKSDSVDKVESYMQKLQKEEISSVYPDDHSPEKLELEDITLHRDGSEKETKEDSELSMKTLEESLAEAEIDESRIIDPSMGIPADALYQYVPATKLKGMDDWLPESLHYQYYSKEKDFPLVVEPEPALVFPEHLKVYTYEMNSELRDFPQPRRTKTGMFNYYPMDCGSVLTVLALQLSPGDRVLDLCSAPGGKALVALQTLLPDIVVCNDVSLSRSNRIRKTFQDYLSDFETNNKWTERIILKMVDGRAFVDDEGYDKVLVDVPCTTDRLSVNEDENNIFRADRIRERLRLPELQSQLLVNALKLVRVGGAVVYSTCSLSPIQNDGVVHMSLKTTFETCGLVFAVKDLSEAMASLKSTVQLARGSAAPRYGQLVLPAVGANFGPSYMARLVRIK